MPDISALPRITPSEHNPWRGGFEDAFTDKQRAALVGRGDEFAASRRQTRLGIVNYWVRLMLAPRVGDGNIPRFVRIKCPTIAASRDRKRILVIAPDGSRQWVDWK